MRTCLLQQSIDVFIEFFFIKAGGKVVSGINTRDDKHCYLSFPRKKLYCVLIFGVVAFVTQPIHVI